MLFPPSLEESLAEAFRPDVANRDVLTPGGYQGAVDGAVGDLRAAAAKATDPAEKAKLESALAVLKDDASLRDLLNTFRHLLHKA